MLIASALAFAACDPGYGVWVVNDGPSPVIVETHRTVQPEPNTADEVETFTHWQIAPPSKSGVAQGGIGAGAFTLAIWSSDCEPITSYEWADAPSVVIHVDAMGAVNRLDYNTAFGSTGEPMNELEAVEPCE